LRVSDMRVLRSRGSVGTCSLTRSYEHGNFATS
jgi:hypothetical protein